MGCVSDEEGLSPDQVWEQLHIQQVPEHDSIVRSRVEEAQNGFRPRLEMAYQLLLVRTLVIPGYVCGKALFSNAGPEERSRGNISPFLISPTSSLGAKATQLTSCPPEQG